MYSGKFTVILHLLVTMLLINCATSADRDGSSESHKSQLENLTTTELSNLFVATTPRISAKISSALDRHDVALDDDGDDEDDVMQAQQQIVQSRQLSDGFNPMLQIFNALSNALVRSAASAAQKSGTELIGRDPNGELKKGDEGDDDYYNDNVTENGSSTTEKAVEEGRGSYIKGDPLNGYYDFIITEGSYKFWVVFQLATAALLIYSTLAAIYYSKVNPLTSDYDYVDYLSRSFKGRSMSEDSADVEDEGAIESGRTYLSSLAHNNWVKAAAYGFQFAMDAIDKVPK